MIFSLVSIFVMICYGTLILTITVGWWKLDYFTETKTTNPIKISVVVAARNEAETIESLIDNLSKQDYPETYFEVIIVDDHSSDDTYHLANTISAKHGQGKIFKILTISETDGYGKKAALQHGISASKGELIVVTDADCKMSNCWLSSIVAYYIKYKPHMLLGHVRMNEGSGFFEKLQALEFMSLIATGAGSCRAGFPLLANGANIAFTRFAYNECGGFSGNSQYVSGDDMFLMLGIKKKFGASAIRFLKSTDAIVETPHSKSLNEFVQQRLRWVSKSKGYNDLTLVAVSIVVYLTNTVLLAALVSAFLFQGYYMLFILAYLIKLLVDLPLMISFCRFQKSVKSLWLFPFLEILNAFYTLLIGIAGNLISFEWKGRKS